MYNLKLYCPTPFVHLFEKTYFSCKFSIVFGRITKSSLYNKAFNLFFVASFRALFMPLICIANNMLENVSLIKLFLHSKLT